MIEAKLQIYYMKRNYIYTMQPRTTYYAKQRRRRNKEKKNTFYKIKNFILYKLSF